MKLHRSFVAILVLFSLLSQSLKAAENLEGCNISLGNVTPPAPLLGADDFVDKIPPEVFEGEGDKIIARDAELASLIEPKVIESACVSSGVCKVGENVPQPFRFLYKFVLRTYIQFRSPFLRFADEIFALIRSI